jgi:hypothetical protein
LLRLFNKNKFINGGKFIHIKCQWHGIFDYLISSLWGGSTGKPENIPTSPDPGNAGEGNKEENEKGFG